MSRGTGPRRTISPWVAVVGALVVGTCGAAARAAAPPAPAQPESPERTVIQSASPVSGRGAAFSLQGGWWSAEAEWRTRFGVYAAAGVPWATVPLAFVNGASWVVPVSARLGYDLALSPRWSVRASGHAATMVANETGKCGCAGAETAWRTFLFAEVGLRYQSPSGFVVGVELPLFGLRTPHHDFPPPLSLAFTQLYIGRSWGR